MRSVGSVLIAGFFIVSLIVVLLTPNCTTTPQPIVMVTDKTHYAQGEIVKLRVTNNLDVPVWYIEYPQTDLVFWKIERAQENDWEVQNFRLPFVEENTEVCRLILRERPVGTVTELKSHAHLLYEWNQKICLFDIVTEPAQPQIIERGRYRFALHYSLCTVETEDIEAEPWKRPIELGEQKTVYSNEFVLE